MKLSDKTPHLRIETLRPPGKGRHALALWAVCLLTPLLFPAPAPGLPDYRGDIGYTAFSETLGGGPPDGRAVPVVQVEAASVTDGVSVWMPDPNDAQFSGKSIVAGSDNPPGIYSGHATGVGRLFYGNFSSIAPGIESIESFWADDWLGKGFLRPELVFSAPLVPSGRVVNHSWIGYSEDSALVRELLARLDWLIDEYLPIHVAAVNNASPNQPLLCSAYNAIVVGRSDGSHGIGTVEVDDVYTGGRPRPHVVAPAGSTSSAAPIVAAAAALLVEVGHENPALSSDSGTNAIDLSRPAVYNAERPEVVKAALMAGADRITANISSPNIVGYRMDPARVTDNGLDTVYGAGQVNILNSYLIIAAGEQNSLEDDPAGGGIIGPSGFDVDHHFGGESGTNAAATYLIEADEAFRTLFASLVWHIFVEGDRTSSAVFKVKAGLYDLDLGLWDITEEDAPVLVADSRSSTENTENLRVMLLKGRRYALRVSLGPKQGPVDWHYGLAWRTAAPMGDDFDHDGDVDGLDLAVLADRLEGGASDNLTAAWSSGFGADAAIPTP